LIEKIASLFKSIIKAFFITIYLAFVISAIIGGIYAGIWTLIPTEYLGWGAAKVSYLGYISHCSFAPYSSFALFAMALVGSFLLIKIMKYIRRKVKIMRQKKIKMEYSKIH